jgi:ketosteroid isomerase-like protein
MKNDNVAAVRNAYAVAERKDLEGWINLFTPDGVFVDNSVGATYRGRTLADRSATTARRFPTCTASYITSTSMAMSSWCN